MSPPNPGQAPFIDPVPAGVPASGARGRITQALVMAALVLPWVTPFAGHPSPAVWPGLVAAWCAGLLLALCAMAGPVALTAEALRRGWVLAASLSAVIGALQYFGASDHFIPWINQTRPGEAFGNLRQRNQFASLMGIGLVALIWRAHGSWGRYTPVLVLLLALGNAASSSRTGAVQWLVIVALAGVFGGPGLCTRRRTALLAFGTYLIWALVLPGLLLTLTGASASGLVARFEETPGCASRLVLWSNVLTLMAQKPWLGWGWGELDFAHYITGYPGERFCDILDNAHNLPLQLAVELGIPLALVVCGVLGWLAVRARPWRETDPGRQMTWGVLTLILLHSLLEYPLWYGPFQFTVCCCVYLLWRTRPGLRGTRHPAGDVPRFKQRGSRLGAAGAALLMVMAATYAAWDYHRVSQIYLAPGQRDPAYRDNTLERIRGTWLFQKQFEFAVLSLTPLTPANAQEIHALAMALLHYSPEPRVIEKVVESAVMLRRDDEALLHLARYKAAFPKDHALWRRAVGLPDRAAD